MKNTHSIGDVVKTTGITEKQLRFWEERSYIPKPERVVCGQRAYRRYTEEQVQFISEIKRYLDLGYQLRTAVRFAEKTMGGGNYGT